MLEKLDMGKIAQAKIEKVPDLKISDYMVDSEFSPDMSYADILRKAMKMEERALKLYNDMKEKNKDENLIKLFSILANEEAKHKLRLEKIYDDEILKWSPPWSEKEREMEKWKCKVCGYIYDPENGDPDGDIPPGTPFNKLPDSWVCPMCGAPKDMFEKE